MIRTFKLFQFVFLSLLLSFYLPAHADTAASDQAFMTLANDYIDHVYFPLNPSIATSFGVHDYDTKLEDYTKAGLASHIAILKRYEARVNAVDPSQLSEQVQADRLLVLNHIRSELLTLDTIRPWQKNPDMYSGGIANAAFVIMERKFASYNDRLKLIIAREKLMPGFLQLAHQNLRNPPKIYTQIAIEQLPGMINFFKQDLPAAFADATDPALKKQFAASNAAVIQALEQYQTWLEKDVLPHASGDFRIGTDAFRKKLAYDEMVTLPLDKLLAIGEANLRQNQAEFARVAHEMSPNGTTEQVLKELLDNHPQPNQLLSDFRGTFDGLIRFIRAHNIITIPSDLRPILEETPPFMRATTFASMDTPGPFEPVAKEAYFNVTLPNPAWDKEKINEFMMQFNYPTINNTSVHETYPGHYVQFLWMHDVNDRVRKVFGANTNSEGWAHYCEQMMLDEGFGQKGNTPKDKHDASMLRLAQLYDALLRNARFIVGIKLHTGQMNIDQAVDYFVKEGYQPRIVGLIETKRGTSDPTYLYYTLGKLEILKLREDVKAKQGAAFKLSQFHDDFMKQGYPPIAIVRKALLGNDSPVL